MNTIDNEFARFKALFGQAVDLMQHLSSSDLQLDPRLSRRIFRFT